MDKDRIAASATDMKRKINEPGVGAKPESPRTMAQAIERKVQNALNGLKDSIKE